MAQSTLTHVLEEIKTLEPEELHQVEQAVRGLLESRPKEADRETALRILQESGLVREVRRPPLDRDIERPLVPIQGKPLSETIIEERR